MPFSRLIVAGAAVLSAACVGCGAARPSHLYVVVNAKVWTGDPAQPSAEAFVVREGRFGYVGDVATARQRGGELAPVCPSCPLAPTSSLVSTLRYQRD